MVARALVVAILATSFPARAASGAGPADTPGLQMSVSAGLGGAGRLGRWMPVVVDIDNRGDDIDGTLVIAWGNAQVLRRVSVPAPSRRSFTVLIRTGDVRDTATATLREGSRDSITATAPVRVLTTDETFTLCVAGEGSPPHACSIVIPAAAMPREWRGYDTADEVLVADMSRLSAVQRDALLLWRGARAAENRGETTHPGISIAEQSRWDSTRNVAGFYLLAVGLLTLYGCRSRRLHAVGVMAFLACAMSITAWFYGRTLPVTIRHSTALRQYAGAPLVLVDMAAVAEFPTDGVYAITPILEGAMNVGPAYGPAAPQHFDAAGVPLLAGRFGLGATQPFQFEATGPGVVDVSQQGRRVRVTNTSLEELRDCELPSSFTPHAIAVLGIGQSLELSRDGAEDGAVLRCRLTGSPIPFPGAAFRDGENHPVETAGETSFTYTFERQAQANESR